jgi:hypothetical protein
MDIKDKFRDCFDAFPKFQDHFKHCRQLLGLLMHFTPPEIPAATLSSTSAMGRAPPPPPLSTTLGNQETRQREMNSKKKINERTAQLNHMTKNRFHRKKNLNNPSLNTESSKIRAIHQLADK